MLFVFTLFSKGNTQFTSNIGVAGGFLAIFLMLGRIYDFDSHLPTSTTNVEIHRSYSFDPRKEIDVADVDAFAFDHVKRKIRGQF